ncbi:signal peptidase II [Microvirga arsenatis]|uniref:Lipoprotein signal peptidase n=1 Tax=Microvirga arsenatis TaxID=2692265 RepID=A0ABW9YTI6_9HYPH|nr:signal peptidase II [Microvirga arsenatis]NBJ09478.1 signal peptidase II [Microvirga arsenatis]NBJ23663.1 signal peptidase II [Microvirga arsenatis]
MVAKRIRRLLEVTVPVVMIDQVSKGLARASLMPGEVHELLPFANLRLGFNRGISFGFLPADEASGVLLLIGITALISLGMAVWSVMAQTWQEATALALILGGALGNLIDRVRDGMVTDFIDLHAAGYHWPTFNGADIAITLGAVWLVVDSLGIGVRRREAS